MREEENDIRWVSVFRSEDRFQTNLVSLFLEENQIRNIVMDKKDTTHVMIGHLEIYVPQESVIRAKHLLATMEEK